MKSKRESLLAGFRIRFGIIIASFVLLSGVEGVFQPLLVKSIFDQGVVKGNLHRFIVLAVIYLVLGLSINGLTFLVSLKAKLLENRICIEVSSRMLQAFYKSNYSDILKRGEGYYISRIRDDVQIGLIPRLRLIISVSSQTALVLGSSAVLIILSWQAFMVLLVVAPLTVVLANLLSKKIQMITTDQREQTGKLLSTLTKALSAFRIVNTFGMVSQTVDTVNAELAQALHLDFRSTRLLSLFQAANDVTMVTSDFISLFVGAVFVIRGKLSFGGYLAFVNSFWRAITTVLNISNQALEFKRLGVIEERIRSFLDTEPKNDILRGDDIDIRDASFSYNEEDVLRNFSARVKAGERACLVGPNGSGKTTIANMLGRFLQPNDGKVSLPERVSVVTLPIAFPPLPIRSIPLNRQLLTEFGLSDEGLLDAYPDSLSSGQLQKLAIALSLSQDADLYVFDEPFANLDRASREVVSRRIDDLTRGKTVVLISHIHSEAATNFDHVIELKPSIGRELDLEPSMG